MNDSCVFVTGAARSGTHLLATLVHKATGCVLLGEINDFWRSLVPDIRHDIIPVARAQPEMAERFLAAFRHYIASDSPSVLLDKTAANSLRLPFLYKLFPKARFLHIIRDGRDVAISIRRKYQGDLRKITKTSPPPDGASGRADVKWAWRQFAGKLHTGLTHRRILREPRRYWAAMLRTLGIGSSYPWGPSVPGLNVLTRTHTPLEVAAYQWRCCVENALAFHVSYAEAPYLEVRYEQLIADPESVLETVWRFLEVAPPVDGTDVEIVREGLTHADILDDAEREQIHCICGWTLAQLGYSP